MIETVLLDIDGVLTDGAVWINASGEETKRILFDDIDAVFALKRAGIRLGFITGEDNGFSDFVKRRFEPDFFLAGCKNKLEGFKTLEKAHGLNPARTLFAGDSKKDIELLTYVGHSFAPSDVESAVRTAAKKTLKAARGTGVVREIAAYVLTVNGKS